ncbi:MAG: hypothetical protein ACT4O2_02655 [Beijerinckiaceae bacterium]
MLDRLELLLIQITEPEQSRNAMLEDEYRPERGSMAGTQSRRISGSKEDLC